MDDLEPDFTKLNYSDPWDSGFYETGSTKPPKNNGGFLALMLIAGILLGSVVNSTGVLRADPAVTENQDPEDGPQFSNISSESTTESTHSSDPDLTIAPAGNGSLELHDTPEAVDNVPQEGRLSLQEIYLKNIDSVVSISVSMSTGTFSGSGVVLTQDGYLVTNAHVIDGATAIDVLLTCGDTYSARIVGEDGLSDLAVLKIDAEDLSPAEFGDSSSLQVGDTVVAIGDPLGVELRGTMTDGIVSAINRVLTTGGRNMTLIQTNAALNSGNSGGPLINCYGQVIGINTMKISSFVSTSTSVEGLGFAIPSTTVKEIVDQLIQQGYVSGRPDLGITGETVDTFYQQFYRMPAGIYVSDVTSGSSAEKIGIQPGDIILYVDDTRVTKESDLQTILYSHQVGDTVTVILYRGGKQYSAEITLEQAT